MTLSLFDYEFQTQISLFVLYNKINIRTDVILFLAGGRRGKEVKKNINAAENSGEALVTVALCNEKCELLYSRMPMQYVRKMDSFSYFVKDHTAYLDAVDELLSLFCRLRQENGTDRSRVLFFLVTDGLDNSSIRVERSEFEKRMESLYAKGWEILVGGKDIDSEFREASDMFLEMRKA